MGFAQAYPNTTQADGSTDSASNEDELYLAVYFNPYGADRCEDLRLVRDPKGLFKRFE